MNRLVLKGSSFDLAHITQRQGVTLLREGVSDTVGALESLVRWRKEEGGSLEREKELHIRARGPSLAVISRHAFDAERTGITSKGNGGDAWPCAGRSIAEY